MRKQSILELFALASGICFFGGCASEMTQLENVNKDWNKIIRASHIYPIYPLSEDLQPGDVFVAREDLEDITPWTGGGYIKLDHLFTRLFVTNYDGFYHSSFDTSNNLLPRLWIHDNSWTNAPSAAFPSYSFSVKQGGGANVSLPISGIPAGLALMGAKSASGHVTIADAHTYGVDEMTLQRQLYHFIGHNKQNLLQWLGTQADTNGPYFLRVVSRVYLTGKVAVSMYHDSSFGVTASGGVPKDVPIPDTQSSNAAANYSNIVNSVNGVVSGLQSAISNASGVAPGGTLKFTAVSSRTVSLEETFARPLVIGYTGFNVEFSRSDLESVTPEEAAIEASKPKPEVRFRSVSNRSMSRQLKSK